MLVRATRALPKNCYDSRVRRIHSSIWSRYSVRARRPEAVRRYSVRGTRPSKNFIQEMYCASSSLRAWTLRLPSVVLRTRLRSLKLRESLVARALTIPRRMRSWMRRSSSGSSGARACSRIFGRSWGAGFAGLRDGRGLATVAPRDEKSEEDVEASETGGQECVSPGDGSEDGE